MSYSFSGPSLVGLFPGIACGALIGALYKSIANTNSSPIYILMAKEVAEYVLYKMATFFVDDSRKCAMIYAATHLVVCSATLALMHQKQLIGILGTALFATGMSIQLVCNILDFPKYRTVT